MGKKYIKYLPILAAALIFPVCSSSRADEQAPEFLSREIEDSSSGDQTTNEDNYETDDSGSAEELETVVVSAKRFPSQQSRTAENIIVINQEDARRVPAQNLGEVLSYMPGVDVQPNGAFGQATSLSINGSFSRQVLVMVDDIPFNTQLSGQANPAQIDMGSMKQVELIKGASSSAWGSSLGGVVHAITKDTGDTFQPKGSVQTSYGEFSTIKNSLDLRGKVSEEVGYFLSGNYYKTDGIRTETDTKEGNGLAKLSYRLEGMGEVIASFGYNGGHVKYGVTPTNTINAQTYNTRYGKILLNADNESVPYSISYKYNHQQGTNDLLNGTTKTVLFAQSISDLYQGANVGGHKEFFDDHLLVWGLDLDWHTIKSSKYLPSSRTVSMQAPYVNYTLPVGDWDFIPGFRYDHNEQFGEQASPSLGTVYHVGGSEHSLVRAKVSRAFNAPPLLWIFNNDPSQFVGPNPDLEAERALVYEVGYETAIHSLEFDLNLYRADVKNGIAAVFDSGNSVFVQRNFRKFIRQGAEVITKYNITEDWMVYGSGAFNDVRNATTKDIVRDQGIARQKFGFGATYHSPIGVEIDLSGYYNRWSSSPSARPNDRKPIFDLKLLKEFGEAGKDVSFEAFLAVHNLTNSKYWSSITFPLAERYFEGGIAVNF